MVAQPETQAALHVTKVRRLIRLGSAPARVRMARRHRAIFGRRGAGTCTVYAVVPAGSTTATWITAGRAVGTRAR
jgi:hypothetical protein